MMKIRNTDETEKSSKGAGEWKRIKRLERNKG